MPRLGAQLRDMGCFKSIISRILSRSVVAATLQRLAILGGKGAHRSLFRDNHKIKNNFGFRSPGTKGIGRFFGSNQLQPDAGYAAKA